MKKISYTFAIVAALSTQVIAQNKNIAFEHGTFKEIKEKALKENKLIFIDAYTTWCGPCKYMAKNTFTNDTVADYFNKNFVNAKIDMEKGEGIEIAKQYDVRCYPNLLFIDGNGNIVHRAAGGMAPKEFIALAEETKITEKCFAYYAKNYEANKTNSDFLIKYISAKEGTCLDADDLVKDYFSLQKESDLTSKTNWQMILAHSNTMDSKEFAYLIANKDKFSELYTTDAVNAKMDDVNRNTLFAIIRSKTFDESKYNDVKNKISSLNLSGTKLVLFEADLQLAKKKLNWTSYSKLATDNVDAFYLNDPNMLNSISWDFYEQVTDKEALIKAESWAKKACDLENSYANIDTYAAILYKNGKKELALAAANKAIEVAKKEKYTPEDYQSTTDLIKKIKELK